jgi:hypothetical protein
MPTNIVIQQVLTSDTPNQGRIKINQNFENFSANYNDHINETNPHSTTLASIPYTIATFTDYANIDNSKEAVDYSVSQLRSHLLDQANPHTVTAAQLSDVTEAALTTSNTITNVNQVTNALAGIKYLYNRSLSLSDAASINLTSTNFAATNVEAGFDEVNTNFTKKSRNDTVTGTWTFTNGLNTSGTVTGDTLELDVAFNLTTANSEVSFVDNYFYFEGEEFETVNDYINLNASLAFNVNSLLDTEFNLSSTTVTFSGNNDTFLNFNDNTLFDIAAGKTLTFEGSKVKFVTDLQVEFAGPPKALYSPDSQQAAELDDFVTRRYVDQFTYDWDSFYSNNPLLTDVTNIRDAINALANQLSATLKDDYSFSFTPLGAQFVIDISGSETFITLPVLIEPQTNLYIGTISYYLPDNVEVSIAVKGEPGYFYTINDTLTGTQTDGTNYYAVNKDINLLVPNNTSSEVLKLIEINLTNLSSSQTALLEALHNLNFGIYTADIPVPTTTTTTTTTTSTTTTTTT